MKSINIINGNIFFEGEKIEQGSLSIDSSNISLSENLQADLTLNAEGLLVLPGIIDLHGDAFERQIMPRPGVNFGHQAALLETDNQMISNGITTAYHGLTYSWEPGLRGTQAAIDFVEALIAVRPRLRADTRLHLRFETYNLPAEEIISQWMEEGIVDLFAFNDHMANIDKQIHNPAKLSVYAGRTGLSPDEFIQLHDSIKSVADQVPAAVERLAEIARNQQIPMASHDDETPEMREFYQKLGCEICEFPVDITTARYATEQQNPVIMGAPNVMRGGSHCGRLSAIESIQEGLCTVLTSDYYYPTLMLSAFKLAQSKVVSLEQAWNLISKNPAIAVKQPEKGVISEGKRADLILVDCSNSQMPVVKAVIVNGNLQYSTQIQELLV